MTYEDIIAKGIIVYHSQKEDEALRSLPIKAHPCKVSYYTQENPTRFDELLCKLLLEEESHSIGYYDLGTKLGFDIVNNPNEGLFFDEAELHLYDKMIENTMAWGLIEKLGDTLTLSKLGEISLERNAKYRFMEGSLSCCVFDVDDKLFTALSNSDGSKIEGFPFYKELGIKEGIIDSHDIGYPEGCVDFVVKNSESQLVKNLQLQVDENIHIYDAKETAYIELKIAHLDVDLYKILDDYYILFSYDSVPCKTLNSIYNLPVNQETKERKVERALYTKLMNDKEASLTYELLAPFEDILDIEILIEDNRLDWKDAELRNLIFKKSNSDNWRKISKYCDIEVLKEIIPQYSSVLDWGELTLRMGSGFISETSKDYPWERNMLIARIPVEKSLVVKFLSEYDFPQGLDDGQWDWEEVVPLVGIDFIKSHIEDIPFNLSTLTTELDDEHKALVAEFPESCWDWGYISNNYPIKFLIDNLAVIHQHLSLPLLLDRIFTNPDNVTLGINSAELKRILVKKKSDLSNRFNANKKEYVWTDDVISFFEETQLINWASSTYKDGFELNQYLIWKKDFFAKYYHKISTSKGYSYISSVIIDNSIVDNFPDFSWDWIRLSSNEAIFNDEKFVVRHASEVDGITILLNCDESLVESYFVCLNTNSLMQDDEFVRARITDAVSIDFLRSNINANWDWSRLTQRVYKTINLKVMGNASWINKWDWDFLSDNLEVDDILEYAELYAKNWKWVTVLKRLEYDCICNNLDKLASILSELEDSTSEWESLTAQLTTSQLTELVSLYKDEIYHWNYFDLYNRADFDAKDYLVKHIDDIQWEKFSSSSAVNRLFAKTGTNKTQSLWIRIYADIVNNENYKWNFKSLSHLDNILRSPRLFMIDKDWDWEYISEYATWISTEKNKDYFFWKYKSNLSFPKLSLRRDIGLTQQVISKTEQMGWDWNALVKNESVIFKFAYIKKHQDKPWNWTLLSSREDLDFNTVEELRDKPWDWYVLTGKASFVPSIDTLNYIIEKGAGINWDAISSNPQITLGVIDRYENLIDWKSLIENNPAFLHLATVAFIKKHFDKISWNLLNKRIGIKITEEMVESFPDYLDWKNVSQSQDILFTVPFVQKYENKWFWSELNSNLKVHNDIPDFETIFAKHSNVAVFIDRLKSVKIHPYIYHFTHLFNAIEVIKSRKILSRDRAEELGLLKFDSAGSVVMRSNLAHPYARFYFRPCTPTQYYNEALGADSQLGYYNKRNEWKSKYPKAVGLGLPKCPIPVFFRFEIEEVLAQMPERCFYSDRNMQSNNPNIYAVTEYPNHLGVEELYSTMQDAFEASIASGEYNRSVHLNEIEKVMHYSQQEFLVESEFDFSNLESLLIICYDKQYTEFLREVFKDDPICEKIVNDDSVYEVLFERENRSIYLKHQDDRYTLSSDFMDEHYFRISSDSLSSIGFDVSSAHVVKDNGKELILTGSIKWTKTENPFNVYFVDPNARTKEWLIYSNNYTPNKVPTKYELESPIRKAIKSFVNTMNDLPINISKELFYPHMVNSYHGIAHTTRVLLATHLLCKTIKLSDEETRACYIAAIIHDLGKSNDVEGAEHGYKSMLLFKEKITSLIGDANLQRRTLNAVRYHSVEDNDCPEEVRHDIIWKVLKDADALDRNRFGGYGCDKSYLRLGIYQSSVGQNILGLTSYLPGWTQNIPWDNPCVELTNQIHKNTDIDNLELTEEWKIILAENIMLFSDMSKNEKCEMLFGYAEGLSDSLTAKLGFDKSEEALLKYVETSEYGIVDKRLDKYTAQKYQTLDENFYKELQKLDILYIEKNVDNLEPLRYCKNLRFLVFDGYWIAKYKFKDFTPLKHLQNVYIWHNSGDTKIDNSFSEYTNIDSFNNIRYSESADNPWSDFCDEVTKFKNE